MNPELVELLRKADAAIAAGEDAAAIDAEIGNLTRGQFQSLDRLRLVLTMQSQEGGSPADAAPGGQTAPLSPVPGQAPRNAPAGGAQPYDPRELLRKADAALAAGEDERAIESEIARITRGEVTSLDNLRLGVEGPEEAFPGPVRSGVIGVGQGLTAGLLDGLEPDQAEVRNVLRRMHPVAWQAGRAAGVGTGARVAAGSISLLRPLLPKSTLGRLAVGGEAVTRGAEVVLDTDLPNPSNLIGQN